MKAEPIIGSWHIRWQCPVCDEFFYTGSNRCQNCNYPDFKRVLVRVIKHKVDNFAWWNPWTWSTKYTEEIQIKKKK